MWYYIPPTTSRSVQELEGLTLQSNLPFHKPGAFVTLSEKHSQQQHSWRGWKTRPWIRLLFGLTLPHSIAVRGVAAWISWLQDFRASQSPKQVNEKDNKTSDGSGKTLSGWFASYDAPYSWRMSQASFLWGSEQFSETWPKAGSVRSGYAYRQVEWEPHIKETDGSAWGTPTSRDWKDGGNTTESVNGLLGRQVTRFSLPAQAHLCGRPEICLPVLSPSFVEVLMGLQVGWTAFAPLEQDAYLCKLRSQFESYWTA